MVLRLTTENMLWKTFYFSFSYPSHVLVVSGFAYQADGFPEIKHADELCVRSKDTQNQISVKLNSV